MRQSISLKSFIGTSRSSWQKSSYAWHAVLGHSFLDDYVSVEAGNVHWDKDCVVRQFSSLNDSYEVCCIFQIRVLFLCYRLYEEAVNKARFSFCGAAYHHVEVARQDLVLKDNKYEGLMTTASINIGKQFCSYSPLDTSACHQLEVIWGFERNLFRFCGFLISFLYGFENSNIFQCLPLQVIGTLAFLTLIWHNSAPMNN